MSDYFIQSIKDTVCVHRIINGELEIIKINGDSYFPTYDFWQLFKQKVEYEPGEQLSFVVITDREGFEIDPEISVAEKFMTPEDDIRHLIFDQLSGKNHLITFPDLKEKIDRPLPFLETGLPIEELEVAQEPTDNNIQSFYRKQTRAIQRKANDMKGGK
tara:strand:- start:1524 stop:2000 length:477 start_codon:yes stop_codon:yes gene_type:complete